MRRDLHACAQVLHPYGDNQLVKAGGVDMPIGPVPQLDIQPVASSMQPITPVGEIGARGPITFLEHTPPIGLISHTVIRATIDRLKPYENYSIIRTGEIIEAEMAYVAESAQAAIVWTTAQGVDVMIGCKKAVAIEGDPPPKPLTASNRRIILVCAFAKSHRLTVPSPVKSWSSRCVSTTSAISRSAMSRSSTT